MSVPSSIIDPPDTLGNLIYEQASDGNMFPHLYSHLDISYV